MMLMLLPGVRELGFVAFKCPPRHVIRARYEYVEPYVLFGTLVKAILCDIGPWAQKFVLGSK